MNRARELLKRYCKPVNHLYLMETLAEGRGIDQSDIQALIESGEYVLDGKWIKPNLFFKRPITKKNGIDKYDLLVAIDSSSVFNIELNQPIKDLKWQSVKCPFHKDASFFKSDLCTSIIKNTSVATRRSCLVHHC